MTLIFHLPSSLPLPHLWVSYVCFKCLIALVGELPMLLWP